MAVTALSGQRWQGSGALAGGRVGTGCGSFDGSERLYWDGDGMLDGDFTIGFWLYKRDTSTYDTYYQKSRDGGDPNNTRIQMAQQASGKMEIWSDAKILESSHSLDDDVGEWHHWALTGDGVDWKLYYDGEEEDTTSSGQASRSGYTIGRENQLMGETSGMTYGYMDEFFIFDRALTASEVLSLADTSKKPTDSTLNGGDSPELDSLGIYLPMDTTASSGLTNWYDDLSGNDITISIGGTPVVAQPYLFDEKTLVTDVPVGSEFEQTNDYKNYQWGGSPDTFGSTADAQSVAGVTVDTSDERVGTGCLVFAGGTDERINVGSVQFLPSGTSDYTYAFWIRFDDASPSDEQVLNGNNQNVETYHTGGDLKFKDSSSYTTLISSTSADTWYHVVIKNSGGTTYGYASTAGNFDLHTANGTSATILSTNPHQWYIGGKENGSESLAGKLDDFAIWDRALTDAERRILFDNNDSTPQPATAISTADLKYYLNCDSADGNNDAVGWVERGTAI